MSKIFKILVIYYSQTGKSKSILDRFIKPLRDQPHVVIDEVSIEPVNPYPFPWPKIYFFSIFPECVYETTVEIKEPMFNVDDDYDLIVLGSQVWFLSISIPLVSFLNHAKSRVFKSKPVITVLSCRKMWVYTQKRLEEYVEQLGGNLVGKVLVTAKGEQMQTLSATRDNLFDDKDKLNKKEWLASEKVLQQTEQQGKELLEVINSGAVLNGCVFNTDSEAFSNTDFSHPEKVARKSFLAWGKWIIKLSPPKSPLRYSFTVVFLFTFFFKVFVGLPLWPFIQRFKKKLKPSLAESQLK